MKLLYSRLLIAVMVLTLIGSTAAGASGASALQGEQSSNEEALTSVSVFAGSGEFDDWDGAALEASFRMPQGIAVLKDGSVLVADSRNHLIRQVMNGQVSTYAGFVLDKDASGAPGGGWHDGAKQTALFNGPSGMDTDTKGNVYIADAENNLIRKISKDGAVSTIAGDGILGNKDGAGTGARFYQPQDVAVAADGTLYVADTLNHLIRRITPDGQVTTLNAPSDRVVEVTAGYAVLAGDYADGKLSASKFNEPTSLAIDKKGNLYVSDTGNHVIRYIDLTEGTVTTAAGLSKGETPKYAKEALYAGGGYADGSSLEARFHSPRGIAITEEQGLVIADSLNHTIRYLVDGQVSTIAGVPTQFGQVDGINGHNLLHSPTDVAVLPNGGLLIADSYNNTIRELEFYELPSNLPQNNQVKVVLEDQVISFDAQPEIVKGRTMVPVRALSEKMGYEIGFDDNERTIELSKGDVKIKLQVGSRVMTTQYTAANVEEQREIEAAPFIKKGRTYVPVRFFSEAFGADVSWDQHTRTVILRQIAEAVEKLPAVDRHSRAAKLEQIKGTVWVSQAGGSMTYRAYNGITLHHGDHIVTEFNSSAVLKTVDRKDEITISENSELYISNLSNASHSKHTSFVLWSGGVGASVTSLVNANDTFKIMTPTGVTNVRGTNFYVGVDPLTGASTLLVNSGLVQAGGNGAAQIPNLVYPGQQLSLIPELGAEQLHEPYMTDLADFINQASPAVIEAMLKAKQKIDQENEELLERWKNELSGSNPSDNPLGLSQDEINQYQQNLKNLLANIAKQALDQQNVDRDRLQDIIDEVNKNSDNKIDLNNVSPLQLSEQQKQQREKQKQLEEQQKKKQEAQNKQREQQQQQAEQHLASMIDKIKAERERIEQENKKQAEEAAKRAEEALKQSLSDAEKQRFERGKQALEQEKRQQEEAQQPKTPVPSTPSPMTPTNRAPQVVEPIADRMMNTQEPLEFNVRYIFDDPDGDALTFTATSSSNAIATVEVEGNLMIINPHDIGSTTITVKAADGKGGMAETSFLVGFYNKITDLRAETLMDSIHLFWNALEGYEEESLTYDVYLIGEGKPYESTKENGITLYELKPNTEYMLRVVAVNHDGEMVAFGHYLATTSPIIQYVEETANSITIAWNYYEGKRIELYLDDEQIDPDTIANLSDYRYTFTDLRANTNYNIRIEIWDDQLLWAEEEISVKTAEQPGPFDISTDSVDIIKGGEYAVKLYADQNTGNRSWAESGLVDGDQIVIETMGDEPQSMIYTLQDGEMVELTGENDIVIILNNTDNGVWFSTHYEAFINALTVGEAVNIRLTIVSGGQTSPGISKEVVSTEL
ncbi:stalk domain-containing protein [Paenibacillus sp. IITD108]|uniref:stalk domain-containing protein n=1 Tax=Paenibacillus sp. IITD108 TaxID=3116649 RepID=UPI002F3E2587